MMNVNNSNCTEYAGGFLCVFFLFDRTYDVSTRFASVPSLAGRAAQRATALSLCCGRDGMTVGDERGFEDANDALQGC